MRKIGELKGKPIIEGNPNEIKKNQIHYKESDGSITLSERKEDNTLSSVTSGSGSGEGVKEYYYKILSHTNDQGMSPLSILSGYGLAPFNTCIYDGKKRNYTVYNNGSDGMEAVPVSHYIILKDSKLQAFSFLDLEVQLYFIDANISIEIPKGNLHDRAEIIASFGATSEEEKAQMKEILNTMYLNYFQEITKEEYESMITYKPE